MKKILLACIFLLLLLSGCKDYSDEIKEICLEANATWENEGCIVGDEKTTTNTLSLICPSHNAKLTIHSNESISLDLPISLKFKCGIITKQRSNGVE